MGERKVDNSDALQAFSEGLLRTSQGFENEGPLGCFM